MSKPWVLASRSEGKLIELRALFASRDIPVVDLRAAAVDEDIEAEAEIECFDTFERNALAKVRYFRRRLPDRVVVADDSGLAVDALDGAPGVRSKRWSGRPDLHGVALDAANNALLMSALAGVGRRSAQFVCAAAWSDGEIEVVARGIVAGHVVENPAGEGGFGYDPFIFIDALGKTMAQSSVSEKQQVSHRARAFLAVLDELCRRGLLSDVPRSPESS